MLFHVFVKHFLNKKVTIGIDIRNDLRNLQTVFCQVPTLLLQMARQRAHVYCRLGCRAIFELTVRSIGSLLSSLGTDSAAGAGVFFVDRTTETLC